MVWTIFVQNTKAKASEVNGNFKLVDRNMEVYTGAGYDTSAVAASASEEDSYEMTAITSTNLTGRTYLKITATFKAKSLGDVTDSAIVKMKIQTQEIAGSYSDSLAYVELLDSKVANASGETIETAQSFIYYHALTAGEISNGVQVKMFSNSTNGGSANNISSFTNINTSIDLV